MVAGQDNGAGFPILECGWMNLLGPYRWSHQQMMPTCAFGISKPGTDLKDSAMLSAHGSKY